MGSTAYTVSGASESGEVRYKAFGATRFTSGTTPTTYRFTGQREEAGLGLYYYGARWYDPALGRFIQADTIIPNPADARQFDRYAYVLNNPLRYTDPTGHQAQNCSEPGHDEGCVGVPSVTGSDGMGSGGRAGSGGGRYSTVPIRAQGRTIREIDSSASSVTQSTLSSSAPPQGNINASSTTQATVTSQVPGIEAAQTAQLRVGDSRGQISPYTNREYAEATIADGSIITHSGSDRATTPGGYTPGIRAANQLADEVGHQFKDYGYATHAEAKLAGLARNQPIGVSRPMCIECQRFFQAIADGSGRTQYVADPVQVHIFIPFGGIH